MTTTPFVPTVTLLVAAEEDIASAETELTEAKWRVDGAARLLVLATRAVESAHARRAWLLSCFAAETAGAAAPKQIEPAQESAAAGQHGRQRTYFEQQIVDVIGINEVTAGDTTTARSGMAQEQKIFELDQAKNADASKSIEQAVLAMFQMYVRLVAKFYDVGRKMKITGDGRSDIVMFDGADIQGVDVRLESSSELDKRNDVKRAATEGKVAAGTATPHDLDVASNAPSIGISKRVVQKLKRPRTHPSRAPLPSPRDRPARTAASSSPLAPTQTVTGRSTMPRSKAKPPCATATPRC